jgi:hypothetical protein
MRPVVAFLRAPQSAAPRRPRHPALSAYWASNPDPSLSPYMDDFAGGLRGRSATQKWGSRVQAILAALGLVLKPSKCTWTPTQVLPHLGVILDTRRELVIAPPAKVAAIRTAASDLLAQGRRPIPARILARFCGRGQALSLPIPSARFFLRSLYSDLATRTSWKGTLRLGRQSRADLQFWAHLGPQNTTCVLWQPTASSTVHSDASLYGWGASLVLPAQGPTPVLARGFWTLTQRTSHINVLELLAVEQALRSFGTRLQGRRVNLYTDSLVAQSVMTTWTSKSTPLMEALRKVHFMATTLQISLNPIWLPTDQNLLADALSRERDTEDWTIHARFFQVISRIWGPFTVDRFATTENRRVPWFNSRWLCPLTGGVDAFAQTDWGVHNNWCNPPFSLLFRLVGFLETLPVVRATVLAPVWPAAPWFRRLLGLGCQTMEFPPSADFFLAGRTGTCLGPPRWRVMAVRIDRRCVSPRPASPTVFPFVPP